MANSHYGISAVPKIEHIYPMNNNKKHNPNDRNFDRKNDREEANNFDKILKSEIDRNQTKLK